MPPFVLSAESLSLFKKNALFTSNEFQSNNPYFSLWQKYISTYKVWHEWYFTIPLYSKKELYTLALKKGKGISIGCIDTGIGIVNKQQKYELHPALQANSIVAPVTYCNCIEDLVHMVFYHITVPYSIYCSRFRFLEDRIYNAVKAYLHTHSLDEFILFIQRYGKEDLFTSSSRTESSPKGSHLITMITKRLQRIVPVEYNGILLPEDTLSYACKSSECSLVYHINHGNKVMGIMVGKSSEYEGVASHAKCMMAKVFLKDATCTAQTFLEGLLMMIKHKIGLVCMSLQIPEDALSDDMRTIITYLIKLIPYTVAPSGNESKTKDYVSFPSSVTTFSVGSFTYNIKDNTYPISAFSQYKKDEGPLYVMPGSSFLMPYTMYNHTKIEHNYIVSHGTSFSAAFITGLLALFFAEIDQRYFTQREILAVLYSSGLFLQETSDWKTKSILGTLDISTALFIVLVLHAVKCQSTTIRYLCEKNFDQCVGIMHLLLKELKYNVQYDKEKSLIFFKTMICSLLAKDLICKEMIPQNVYCACCDLMYECKKDIFSQAVKHAIKKYAYEPLELDYNLLVRVCGVYEADRIREYVESYIYYYWKSSTKIG